MSSGCRRQALPSFSAMNLVDGRNRLALGLGDKAMPFAGDGFAFVGVCVFAKLRTASSSVPYSSAMSS